MASMLASVGKWVAQFAAKEAWKAISGNKADPTAALLHTVIEGQREIAQAIENLSIKLEILDAMRRILHWSKRMDEIMDDFKTLNKGIINENDPNYVELLSALRNENLGVRYSTFSIYNAIMGLPGQGAGAIFVWHGQAMPKLQNQGNLNYFMADYVKEMDDNLGPIAYLLRQGLVLSLFTSYTEVDAERLRKECDDRITTIADTLFNTLYPPGLRWLKRTLDGTGTQLGSQWQRWQQKDKRNYFLVMNNFYIPCLGSGTKPIQTNKTEAWNFSLYQNSQALGPMQFWSAWDNKGNKRLRYSKMYQQGWNIDFSTSTNKDTSAILFKLIPLESNEAGTEAVFRFVPYLEGSKQTVTNNSKTFSAVFIPLSPQ